MKNLFQKFEALWVAITFAEAGELDTAQEFIGIDPYEADEPEIYQAA